MFHSNSSRKESRYLRVAVMGGPRCGKTSILNQYIHHIFADRHQITKGEVHSKKLQVRGEHIQLQIWDAPDDFNASNQHAILNSDAFLLVYAMDDALSFERVMALQDNIISTRGPVTIVLAGTKADLTSDQWFENQKYLWDFVSVDFGYSHHEISSKTGRGISEVFADIVKQWRKAEKRPKKMKLPKCLRKFSRL
ncbi:ras-like protein 1 [Haliotis rubra]|uniref:ras-like protein 1 n=1 Tax=Haliotis rubra TaxID=36100 RepID=UPI001EE62726|nr:ras-like protein 1 [Haliotis rubra]